MFWVHLFYDSSEVRFPFVTLIILDLGTFVDEGY